MARMIDGPFANHVGENIRKYRKMRHMSQQKLADKLELMAVYICRVSISRVEDRTRTVTDIELYALAEVLGVEIGDLFEGATSNAET